MTLLIKGAVTFGFCHGCQMLIVGLFAQNSTSIRLSSLLVLVSFELLYSSLFFISQLTVAPFYVLINKTVASKLPSIFVTATIVISTFNLMLFALVPILVFQLPDDPGYFHRLLEFLFPVFLSGSTMGLGIWRERTTKAEESRILERLFK